MLGMIRGNAQSYFYKLRYISGMYFLHLDHLFFKSFLISLKGFTTVEYSRNVDSCFLSFLFFSTKKKWILYAQHIVEGKGKVKDVYFLLTLPTNSCLIPK